MKDARGIELDYGQPVIYYSGGYAGHDGSIVTGHIVNVPETPEDSVSIVADHSHRVIKRRHYEIYVLPELDNKG